ncbi:MAG TPA: GntG family PLP-dependent aldolase [Chloroflexota bacterium]
MIGGSMLVDLRSDTVTLPSDGMRAAMAAARLGDDVYGEDPTVNALEERAAARLDKQAGLFVASGTMGNLLAVLSHTQPGDEVVCGRRTHTYVAEGAGAARIAGVSVWPISQECGQLEPREIAAAVHPANDPHYPRSRLLIVEQPHAGWPIPIDALSAITRTAHEHGLAVHMDGARIFNAETALGVPAADIARDADSVMFCFSKGLAAPVGSVLVGTRELIGRARRHRKALGGGMRQAGVLAAAGLYALDHMVERLGQDHACAGMLADGLRRLGWWIDREDVQTNIFFVEPPAGVDVGKLVEALDGEGIRLTAPRAGRVMRLVTHYGIEAEHVEQTLASIARLSAAV